jgi:hypothetical protein
MNQLTFTVLIGGSMVVTMIVWIYLVAITIRQYRHGTTESPPAT